MIKYVDDYIDQLQEKYPNILRSDIKKIVNFGFRLMFRLVRRGLDVQIQNRDLWFYVGELTYDGIKHYHYYKRKLLMKIRYIFEQKYNWDGYYYLAVPDKYYEKLTKVNPIKNIKVSKATMFKCLDAAKVFYDGMKHFVKFKAITDLGYQYYREQATIKNVQLVYSREKAMTLKDLMIDSKNYDII